MFKKFDILKFDPRYEKTVLEVNIPKEELPFEPENFLLLELPESHRELAQHFMRFADWLKQRDSAIIAGLYLVRRRRRLFKPNVYEVKLRRSYY